MGTYGRDTHEGSNWQKDDGYRRGEARRGFPSDERDEEGFRGGPGWRHRQQEARLRGSEGGGFEGGGAQRDWEQGRGFGEERGRGMGIGMERDAMNYGMVARGERGWGAQPPERNGPGAGDWADEGEGSERAGGHERGFRGGYGDARGSTPGRAGQFASQERARGFGGYGGSGSADGERGWERYSQSQERSLSQRPHPQRGFSRRPGATGGFGDEGYDEDRRFLGERGEGTWAARAEPGVREQTYRGRGPKGYTRSDERIKEDVCDALTDHWGIDASEVEVQVQRGEVTLTGTVTNRQQKRLAEDLVETLSGVREVTNQLRVKRKDQGARAESQQSAKSDQGSPLQRGQPDAH